MSKEQWQIYLGELYSWAREKYDALLRKELSEEEYYKVLEFYEGETQVISFLIQDQLEFLEPSEIEEIINSFQDVKSVSSLQELIERRYMQAMGIKTPPSVPPPPESSILSPNSRVSLGSSVQEEVPESREKPSIHNIPRPPTMSELAKIKQPSASNSAESIEDFEIPAPPEGERRVSRGPDSEALLSVPTSAHDFGVIKVGVKPNMAREIRIALVGERSVGRSTLLDMLIESLDSGLVISHEGTLFRIQFHDVDHTVSFPNRSELVGFDGVIAMYDITRPDTMFRLEKWIRQVFRERHFSIPIVVCGNKTDLERLRIVSSDAAEDLVALIREFGNYATFLEVSLKTGQKPAALRVVQAIMDLIHQ